MSSHVIFSLFIAFSATTAGTIIILLGYEGFIKSDKTCDPLLLIFGVLKNAATVKRPNDRTAFHMMDDLNHQDLILQKKRIVEIFQKKKLRM